MKGGKSNVSPSAFTSGGNRFEKEKKNCDSCYRTNSPKVDNFLIPLNTRVPRRKMGFYKLPDLSYTGSSDTIQSLLDLN